MSRFTRALAATTMAVAAAGGGLLIAAAGGGLLIAAAGAAPAYAAAPAASAHLPRGHMITITAHPRAGAAHGIGPHVILPCVVKPDAKKPGVMPASCGQQTISCEIFVGTPYLTPGNVYVFAGSYAQCDSAVPNIRIQQSETTPTGSIQSRPEDFPNVAFASAGIDVSCQTGRYANSASALISFPPGYVLTAGSNPMHDTSPAVTITCPTAGGGGGSGGGGGGGCAIRAPSSPARLAGRHPDFVSCS